MQPKHPSPPRAIFLDAMGTLFTLQEPVGQTYARIAAAHDVHVDAAELDAAFRAKWRGTAPPLHPEGMKSHDDDRAWWQSLVRDTFASAARWEAVPAQFSQAFDDIYDFYANAGAWRLYDDTHPALVRLRHHSRLFVVSNFDGRLRSILRGLGIGDFFEQVIVSSEAGASKPHPRIFAAALAACEVAANECLHVGDEPHADREGALNAGIASFLLKRPQIHLGTLAEKLAAGDFPACIGIKCG